MSFDYTKGRRLNDVIEIAPKTITKDYLQLLNNALFQYDLESDVDIEAIVSSLLLIVIDQDASPSERHFAIVILQKLSPITSISEILNLEVGFRIVYTLPVLLVQDINDSGTKDVIKKLIWCLCNENFPTEYQCQLLAFTSKTVSSPNSIASPDDMQKISALLSEWMFVPATITTSAPHGFRRSSSALSITEIDGTNSQDFYTVLNYVSTINPNFLRNIQVFSMLRSFLCNANESERKGSRLRHSFIGGSACDDLSHSIREYCMRIIDQVDRKASSDNVVQFQKACLVEAIHLFDIICLMDSGVVHSLFPIVRRIYDQVFSNAAKQPEAQDVALMASAMQFFINHGSSVMHKPDNLYVYLFCDLLNICYKDNYITYEILQLMKENLSQLCYHSSILEKYFPTFFKVLAWRPSTYSDDFLELLPAFLSQHTSLEVFYSLLDLPCLTAILILSESKSGSVDASILKNPLLIEALKKPDIASDIKFMLRKTSGVAESYKSIVQLHQALSSLTTQTRVAFCAEAVIPLLRRYFDVVMQYADESVISLLVPALIERLSSIFPVPKYAKEVHSVLANATVKMFDLHPEAVFHCQKNIISYISHFKNYYVSEKNFTQMVWVVGEYVSVAYSSICRPEIIATFFENLEMTTYEALSSLQDTAGENFLKLLSVSLTTLSKLAARNQDQVPRAVLCLTKAQQHLASFNNCHKKAWKIVFERVLELLSILNSPNVAAIVLSPPKNIESGRLHRDSTSLPYVMRAITEIVSSDS